MAANLKTFSSCVASKTLNINERAVAFLFYRAQMNDIQEASLKDIIEDFKHSGLPLPNPTRLKSSLNKDRRTTKVAGDKWRVRSDKIEDLRVNYSVCLGSPTSPQIETDSVIPRGLVEKTRDYIEDVVRQINGSYDIGCFDASGVMIRRLIETLIIETFEYHKIQLKIKGKDGNYFMLEKLIDVTLCESKINLGRNAKKGLSDAKRLGDQSAHNRRFLALQADIDRIQPNIRILTQELVTLAGLKRS